MMICNYFSFLIDEIWFDWQVNILFGIIPFSILVKFNLICGIWAVQIIRDRPLGPTEPSLHFVLAPRGLDIAWRATLLCAWPVLSRSPRQRDLLGS